MSFQDYHAVLWAITEGRIQDFLRVGAKSINRGFNLMIYLTVILTFQVVSDKIGLRGGVSFSRGGAKEWGSAPHQHAPQPRVGKR